MRWGTIFNRYLARGHDHGSAAYAADQWEKRQQRDRWSSPEVGDLLACNGEGGTVLAGVCQQCHGAGCIIPADGLRLPA